MKVFLLGLFLGYILYYVIDVIAMKIEESDIKYECEIYDNGYTEDIKDIEHKTYIDKPEVVEDYDFLPYGKDSREVCK